MPVLAATTEVLQLGAAQPQVGASQQARCGAQQVLGAQHFGFGAQHFRFGAQQRVRGVQHFGCGVQHCFGAQQFAFGAQRRNLKSPAFEVPDTIRKIAQAINIKFFIGVSPQLLSEGPVPPCAETYVSVNLGRKDRVAGLGGQRPICQT